MTFGIGYSKLADFNNTSFAYNQGIGSSITEIFAERMNGVPVSIFNTDDPYRPFRQSLRIDQWGGGLAYQAHLLEPINDKQYSPFGPSAQYPDRKGALSETATVNPAMRRITTGSIGEYDFSGGFNFNNILYVGLTIGVQDVYLRSENNYTETYNNNEYNLQRMNYVQRQRLSGTGVNFKFGAIVRPVPNLRIGVAVHTPTFISMEEEYIELLGADYKGTSPQGLIDSPFAINNYNINTPTRLLTGISYTLPKVGLISVDYERVWYNGMRLRNTGYWNVEEDTKNMIGDMYKAANNFRAGLGADPVAELLSPRRVRLVWRLLQNECVFHICELSDDQIVPELFGRPGVPFRSCVSRSDLYLHRLQIPRRRYFLLQRSGHAVPDPIRHYRLSAKPAYRNADDGRTVLIRGTEQSTLVKQRRT